MGWNTTVVVLNDALDSIARDPDFGWKLADAIRKVSTCPTLGPENVSAGMFVNAAVVVESHHASGDALVRVGGNTGSVERVTPRAKEKK